MYYCDSSHTYIEDINKFSIKLQDMEKHLYIIGNGFDRNLGLKTSYREFYNFYKRQESNDENVIKIKESIAKEET